MKRRRRNRRRKRKTNMTMRTDVTKVIMNGSASHDGLGIKGWHGRSINSHVYSKANSLWPKRSNFTVL